MMPAQTQQIKAFHAILKERGLMDEKKEIVKQISSGRTESSKELSYEELQGWIDSVNSDRTLKKATDNKSQRMINNIIAMAREMGVIERKPGVRKSGKIEMISDYTLFEDWMLTKSYLKKRLSQYTYEELPTLVTQYKNIYLSWLKKK